MGNVSTEGSEASTVAVLDVGKTNVKLSAVTPDGAILETLTVANTVINSGPWRHHDLAGLGDWVFSSLSEFAKRYRFTTFVSSGHGSGGVLVGTDPDAGDGTAMPMIDYEQMPPADIQRRYSTLAGSFLDRGSAVMHAATHLARQMFWMQQAEREAFDKAKWFLNLPQYWAWRLSGVAVSEATGLGAQSHLWNVAERRWAPIVGSQGWTHLMPPLAPAWQPIGRIRPELAERHGLPKDMRVLTGIHDSSANFYRYQASGLGDATVLSTGTWIVALSGRTPIDALDERRGMTLNSDVHGNPVGGILTMGGREFTHVAGADSQGDADPVVICRLISRGTMALPYFGDDDGLFPGSAGRGAIIGALPADAAERKALAVLYVALLTVECLDALGSTGRVVLDGSFLRDPLFAALVAALRPQGDTVCNPDNSGVASGAALLAEHETRMTHAPIALEKPIDFHHSPAELSAYRRRWQDLSARHARSQPLERSR